MVDSARSGTTTSSEPVSGSKPGTPAITLPDSAILALFCVEHHVARLSLFGSALTGPLRPESDVDILIEFLPDHVPGFFRLAAMERELTAMFGRKADLRTAGDLSRHFRDDVVCSALELFNGGG